MIRNRIKNMPVVGTVVKNSASFHRKIKGVLAEYLFYQKHRSQLAQNKNLAKSAAGKRCFILATGPSIKKQDLSGLAGELCISVSNFFVHPDFKKIQPEYHIFAGSHDPITDEQMVQWFTDAETHFKEGQKVVLSLTDKYIVDRYGLFKKQKLYYYLINEQDKTGAIKTVDFSKRIPAIQTVGHTAIQWGLFLGVTEIYLLGCDHDWILNLGKSSHFYDEKESALVRKGYDEMQNRNMENEFKNYLNLWSIYRRLAAYAQKCGTAIYNSTPGSLLDVFPGKALEEVIQKK